MKFKRRFYDDSINYKDFSRRRLVVAVIIGLVFSMSIYSFFIVLNESFRVIFFSNYAVPNILEGYQKQFLHLFYAIMSTIFGNSIAISFLFTKKETISSRRNPKRKRIINDQVFLNSFFLHWFAKLGLTFGVLSIYMIELEYSKLYSVFAVLLFIVLYLETWKTLNLALGKKRYKFMFLNILIISCVAFSISRIDVVDYTKHDKALLFNKPVYKLPKSFFDNKTEQSNPVFIDVQLKLNENKIPYLIIDNKRTYDFYHLKGFFIAERNSMPEYRYYKLMVRIYADQDVKMEYIKAIEAQCYTSSIYRIAYVLYNEDYRSRRFKENTLNTYIKESSVMSLERSSKYPLPPPPPGPLFEFEYKDTIKVDIGKHITFNNKLVAPEMLVSKFQQYINASTGFEYALSTESSYQLYINVLSAHYKAADNLRQIATKGFNINKERYLFSEYEKEEYYKLKQKYPVLISEKLK